MARDPLYDDIDSIIASLNSNEPAKIVKKPKKKGLALSSVIREVEDEGSPVKFQPVIPQIAIPEIT